MLKFKRLLVESFYSLGKAKMLINNGICLVYGQNNDIASEYNVSNGAGKTSLFNAIYQGLFNKNLKDLTGTIASVNNIYYGKPYTIDIVLERNNIEYRIINDRSKGKITIYKNGIDISVKSLKLNLDFIKNEIIGFDFNVFTALTFLNQHSLNAIIDLTNQNNLLYQFFEIDKLGKVEKALKDYIKKYKEDQKILSIKEQDLINNLSFLENHYIVEEGLLEQINSSKNQLENIRAGKLRNALEDKLKELDNVKTKINDMEKILYRIDYERQRVKKEIAVLKKGKCPVCGADVTNLLGEYKNKLNNIEIDYNKLDNDIKLQQVEKKSIVATYNKGKEQYDNATSVLKTKIEQLEYKYELQKEQAKKADEIIKRRVEIEEELKRVKKAQFYIENVIVYSQRILNLLKSGKILDIYLANYIKLYKRNIAYYSTKSPFNFVILVALEKGKIKYGFKEKKGIKNFNQLSSGEKTRVSLVLLLATLKSLEQLTGIAINFLVLDELLGVLDEEGIAFIKEVLKEMKKEKAVFVITHHNEIDKSFGDYELDIIKNNNISNIIMKNLKLKG